jgi:hypothetical protein
VARNNKKDADRTLMAKPKQQRRMKGALDFIDAHRYLFESGGAKQPR